MESLNSSKSCGREALRLQLRRMVPDLNSKIMLLGTFQNRLPEERSHLSYRGKPPHKWAPLGEPHGPCPKSYPLDSGADELESEMASVKVWASAAGRPPCRPRGTPPKGREGHRCEWRGAEAAWRGSPAPGVSDHGRSSSASWTFIFQFCVVIFVSL